VGTKFWVKRFFVVLCGAFIIISGAQMLKGHDFIYCITQGLLWSVITATIFVLGRIYQSRRGQHCSICQDTPEVKSNDL